MKFSKKLVLALILVVFSVLISSIVTCNAAGDNWYYNQNHGFKLNFPVGWVTKENVGGAVVMAMPAGQNPAVGINVVVMPAPSGITAETMMNQGTSAMDSMFKNFRVYDQGTETINGLQAVWHIVSFGEDERTAKMVQYIVITNGKAYVISGGTPVSVFDNYIGLIDDTAKTFIVGK